MADDEKVQIKGEWEASWEEDWKRKNWNKDWTDIWKEKWYKKGMKTIGPEMSKIMKDMGALQGKTSKLIVLMATKKSEEDFKEDIKDLKDLIKDMRTKIDEKYDELKINNISNI